MSDIIVADYENVFDYSFEFDSLWVDKVLESKIRLCFNKLSKYQKTSGRLFDYLPPTS